MDMTQCAKCPWRDMDWMRANALYAVEAAEAGASNWHCHVRGGPCPGPVHAGVLAK